MTNSTHDPLAVLSAARSIRQHLLDGGTPDGLSDYEHLLEYLAEAEGFSAERTIVEANTAWARLKSPDNPCLSDDGNGPGWSSPDVYLEHLAHSYEFWSSSAVRDLLRSRLSPDGRAWVAQTVAIWYQPELAMRLDRAGSEAERCMTCKNPIPPKGSYVAIWDPAVEDQSTGWFVCMPCGRRFLPEGLSLVEAVR